MTWLITVSSKQDFSDKDRDFIAELISEEARKMEGDYNFILHNIIESKRYCKVFIEGAKIALDNLLSVFKDNLSYKVAYVRYNR